MAIEIIPDVEPRTAPKRSNAPSPGQGNSYMATVLRSGYWHGYILFKYVVGY